ncbi:MAG: hypothetical protein HQL32_14720 [Planctomycetes bacterium]|nr:hypothetical protein [Planctomycetota bacterium]
MTDYGNKKWAYSLKDSATAVDSATSASAPSAATPYLTLMTVSTDGAGDCYVYANSTEVIHDTPLNYNGSFASGDNSNIWTVGNDYNGGAELNGIIRSIVLWNRAFSTDEASAVTTRY